MPIMTADNAAKSHFHLQRDDKNMTRPETKWSQETGLVDYSPERETKYLILSV